MFEQTMHSAARSEIERVGQFVAQRDDAWSIPRVSAELLHVLILAGGFRRGIEIGTSYGYSGLWLGAALQHNGGVLLTIEPNAAKVVAARESFRRAGLSATINIIEGTAEARLPELDGPFDFAFVDAEKPASLRYFDLLWPKLAHRATIVTDNITSHAAEMESYAARLRSHPQLCSTLVPIGSGLEVSIKLDPFASTVSVDGADWVI